MDYSIKTLSQLRPILQGFRKTAGLTQAAMASHLGVTQQTYAQLEANPAAVSVERLVKVLRVLQVDLKLTQSAGESAESAAAENAASVRAATPVAARTTSARPAKKAPPAATGDVKRKTPSTRKQTTSAETPARIKSPAKPGARTNRREVGGNTASEAQRTPAKARRVSKKRENW